MFTRLLGAGIGMTTVVASTVALSTAPAVADPSSPPAATDIVGVGSDTSQFALDYLADGKTIGGTAVPGYNDKAGVTRFLRTFHADGDPATIVLQSGHSAITRPNGSGAGIALLHGAGNNTDVDFARSSSAIDSSAASDGLQMFPFALDTLKTAVAKTTHAPTSLTIAQLVSIYKGDVTNWSAVGGSPGVIKPLIPQSGSGTRKFFEAQLKAANGNVAVTYAPSVATTQEHDDTDVKNNPDAIAPFSAGRAKLLGTVRLEGGFSANRALYNVVRSGDVANPGIQAIFGETGFVCSSAATSLISAAGFIQLASSANGGDCGVATQTATSNFQTSGTATTTTTLTASQPSVGAVHLSASVTGGADATGSVTFTEGTTTLGTGSVVNGHATLDLSGVPIGDHTYKATFTPSDSSAYTSSVGTRLVKVRQTSAVTATLSPASSTYGQKRSAVVGVSSPAGTPTGNVVVSVGSWSATRALTAGAVTVALPQTIGAGNRSLLVSYAGDNTFAASSTTRSFAIGKSRVTLAESFPASVAKNARAAGIVRAALAPSSTVRPVGRFTIKKGTRVIASGTLSGGARRLVLPKLTRGTNRLVLAYAGNASTLAASKVFTILQK